MSQYLLFDIGGTFIKYALADENGAFLEQGKVSTPLTTQDDFFAAMFGVCDLFKGKIDACCVSMPGRIDTNRGIPITAGALSLFMNGFPMGDKLHDYLGVTVTVGNDGKCAASAEAWSGALKDAANGLVVVLGTGTGGGVIIDHKVYLGTHFSAGELSEFVYDGPRIQNGYEFDLKNLRVDGTPFWMSLASASALINEYKERKGIPVNPGFGSNTDMSGEYVFKKLREGEKEAAETLQYIADGIATGIWSLQTVIDVEKVAIGGGLSNAPELIPAIQESVHKYFSRFENLVPVIEPEIVKCHYGSDANLIGALKLHKDLHGE